MFVPSLFILKRKLLSLTKSVRLCEIDGYTLRNFVITVGNKIFKFPQYIDPFNK